MVENVFVLGGGASGILASAILEIPMISSNVYGINLSALRAPFYIHYSRDSKHFLKSMDFPTRTRKLKIGYFVDGELKRKPTKEMIYNYFNKSRMTCSVVPPKHAMSCSGTAKRVFIVDTQRVLSHLLSNVCVVDKNVSRISLENNRMILSSTRKSTSQCFTKLVCTFSARSFLKLIGDDVTLNAVPTTFVSMKTSEMFTPNFDYVYFPERNLSFSRLSFRDNYSTLEFAGEKDCVGGVVVKDAQIVEDANFDRVGDVYFVGRYAQWSHAIKLNDVIDRCYKLKKESL